ncbi:RES domain-containing protein [Hymenobacter wooponensis]|uniref:RES domain-containing protein n=1 Tax=Hymenobacter wooponensis TaxID=1525360 RepID=A0A4Z0MHC5_9BACT|nr:RES domain-containing protein [Hymenobacter wooponensis]TGD78737.1 RES domain-containing protein [Hymenobacter wooponensis]
MASSPSRPPTGAVPLSRQLASLRHLDLRKHSIDELTDRVRQLLEGQTLRCLNFAPGLLLYRGIVGKKRPECVSDVSYPPAERAVRDQRANRAGSPMFYCSATWHPPFFEAGVVPGDHIVISRWQTRKPLRIISFGYADVCVDDPHTDRDQALRWALRQLPDDTRALAQFLTGAFTRTVHDDTAHHYRLSIAIAEAFQLGSAFDGLLHPSAAMPSPAHNLALHPSCLDEGMLALQYVEQLRVNRIETETIDVCSINIARESNEDGQLEWMERPGNWVMREGAQGSDLCYQNGLWQ